jgi:hypothetical protein
MSLTLQSCIGKLGYFIISWLEAILKCSPVIIIQLLAILPLLFIGQGQEAMRALLEPAPVTVSFFLFPILLGYSCLLTASFMFFMLARWNYPADDSVRAFCRIWVPSLLTLMIGLSWPLTVELKIILWWPFIVETTKNSTIFDAQIGLVHGVGPIALVFASWKQTKPNFTRRVTIFLGIATATLLILFVNSSLSSFYAACIILLTLFCALICNDFRDSNPNFQPWPSIYLPSVALALILMGGVLLLSAASTPWRMFIGNPTIILSGFLFLLALAFLLMVLASRLSPVLVNLSWLLLVIVILLTPLNNEPLRVLPAASNLPIRLPPSAHFVEWLRSRPEVTRDAKPYPVFFVAAQGGGVRAAYWTSTLLAGLEERYPGFTNHIYAISGVSGGSVGSAIFTSMYHDLPKRGGKGCAPLVMNPTGIHGLRSCSAYVYQWDLLGPPLAGLLLNDLPFGWWKIRRAQDLEQGLETAWFGSMETRRFEEPFQDLWRDRPYAVPSLILNSTSVDNGHRLVVSNLAAMGELTTEPDVEALLKRPVRLSTATFLSARFPLISPLATFDSECFGHFRLADGGYFNNSGMASIASLLRAILPTDTTSSTSPISEFAGRIQPIVLLISNSPVKGETKSNLLAGSFAGSLVGQVPMLMTAGEAHEATYTKEVVDLVGNEWVAADLRPPNGSSEVALGWMLSAKTRCNMDQMVNTVLNRSDGSAIIGRLLERSLPQPATWTSCEPKPKS